MDAREMEKWLIKKGAVPVNEEIKEKPWYQEVSKLPLHEKRGSSSITIKSRA